MRHVEARNEIFDWRAIGDVSAAEPPQRDLTPPRPPAQVGLPDGDRDPKQHLLSVRAALLQHGLNDERWISPIGYMSIDSERKADDD